MTIKIEIIKSKDVTDTLNTIKYEIKGKSLKCKTYTSMRYPQG